MTQMEKNIGSDSKKSKNAILNHLSEINKFLNKGKISKKVMTMTGAVLMLATLLGIRYQENGAILPTNASVQNRVLPIYCVQTDEPKIALTFDAAWGDMRWMEL